MSSKHTLTPEENGWCRDLRDAMAAAKPPVTLPSEGGDFLLAQFALIGKGQTSKALERVRNYNQHVVGGYKYSMQTCAASPAAGFFERKFPGMMYVVPNIDRDGLSHPVMCFDVLGYEPDRLEGKEEFEFVFQEMFLMFDTSGDGYLSCDEFTELVKAVEPATVAPVTRGIFL